MKKYTFTLLAIASPIALFAQAPAPSSNFDPLIMILLVCIIVFIICRELICWYYKINKMVANQEEIIKLLRKIADKGESKEIPEIKEAIIDPFNKK